MLYTLENKSSLQVSNKTCDLQAEKCLSRYNKCGYRDKDGKNLWYKEQKLSNSLIEKAAAQRKHRLRLIKTPIFTGYKPNTLGAVR